MADTAAIVASGLAKCYGPARVLDGIDLAVPAGAVLALLGPNGAGKTTTVRILATLTRPDAGWARIAGYDTVSQRHQVRRRIGLTGQNVALDQLQTGAENAAMAGRLGGLTARAARARARELLARFDLADAGDRRVSTYSGGMRRRLDLAAGLTGRPQVVFLDEPTTGLDPRSRQEMWAVLRELAAAGTTILLTTQYLDEADRLADRVVLLDRGRIVAHGPPDQLKQQVAVSRLELHLAGTAAFDEAARRLGRRMLRRDQPGLTIEVAAGPDAAGVRSLLDEIDPQRSLITRFSLRAASLDDVFLTLTGRPPAISAVSAEKETADA